nr:flagellar basal body rod C-terminal domain-containing protein [Pectinatus haikarae]
MAVLGTASSTTDDNVTKMTSVVTQVDNSRQAVSGVNWNEELTNMIKFQQGYSACARVLTTMDEMLDKLINSTGTVGR